MRLYKVTFIHTGRTPVDCMIAALDFPRAVRCAAGLAGDPASEVYCMRIGAISQREDIAAIDFDAVSESRICLRVHDLKEGQ